MFGTLTAKEKNVRETSEETEPQVEDPLAPDGPHTPAEPAEPAPEPESEPEGDDGA